MSFRSTVQTLHRYASRVVPLAVIAVLMISVPASAGDDENDGGHERERDHHRQEAVSEAVRRGEIKPLADVLQTVRPKLPGEIVGVEVEFKDGAWIYEFRAIDAHGRMFDVYVGAATADIIKIEEK
jgi:uncharacterized membrane protein YkoI